jgi:hypothetical protein
MNTLYFKDFMLLFNRNLDGRVMKNLDDRPFTGKKPHPLRAFITEKLKNPKQKYDLNGLAGTYPKKTES